LTATGDIASAGIKVFVSSASGRQYEALFTLGAGQDFVTLEIKHLI
jgi:hypothetical protein